jgi:hypothetical protein
MSKAIPQSADDPLEQPDAMPLGHRRPGRALFDVAGFGEVPQLGLRQGHIWCGGQQTLPQLHPKSKAAGEPDLELAHGPAASRRGLRRRNERVEISGIDPPLFAAGELKTRQASCLEPIAHGPRCDMQPLRHLLAPVRPQLPTIAAAVTFQFIVDRLTTPPRR